MRNQMLIGKTGIGSCKNGFGALPIQRISTEDSARLLRKAYENGITFFDTARFYTDSEEKIGVALHDVRCNICIASKTMATDGEDFRRDLDTSLKFLKTDYIDIYQFHNPSFCPKPGDGSGLYEAMTEAKRQGKIRHIGITNHRIGVAREAVASGLYETLQFPFSYLASDAEIELVNECLNSGMGFIAMKALAGGLISNSAAAYAFMMQFDVLPIWGIQRESELDDFISYMKCPPDYSSCLPVIQKDREELSGGFCRGCGYCLPCPKNIDIPTSARMSLMLRRAPLSVYLSEQWIEKMKRIDECINCNHCRNHCPYGLDTPALLRENREDYKKYIGNGE